MKKTMKIKALLLAIVMLVSLAPASVYAQKGPYKDYKKGISSIYLTNTNSDVVAFVFSNGVKCDKVKGISYSAKTNTLTLKDLKKDKLELHIQNMGENFKINLKGTNRLAAISHSGDRKLGAGIRFTGKGKLEINKKKIYKVAISVESNGGKNSVVVDSSANLKIYSPAKGYKIYIKDSTLSRDKAISFSGAKKITSSNSYYIDGALNAWLPVDKGDWANRKTVYPAKLKENGKKCYVQAVTANGKKMYWVLENYTTVPGLGTVASVLHCRTRICETKKSLNMLCKVDFSKKSKCYVINDTLDSDYYTKNGKGTYLAFYCAEEHCYKMYKVLDQKVLGSVTGTYVETIMEKDNCIDFDAAGYATKSTKIAIHSYFVD